jgi:hypothetical protein
MNRVLSATAFLLALLLLVPSMAVLAKDKEKEKKKGVKKTSQQKARALYEFNDFYYADRSMYDDPQLEALRAKAKVSVNEVDAQQRYVDFLAPSDLNKLPIGLKKKIGNTTVKIAVSNAIFTPRYAELTVYAKVEIPQNNNTNLGNSNGDNKKTIFFGVKGLKLSKDGGIIGDAKLVLMGDYAIPMNGGKTSLVLKGGFDINTGQATDKTFITIDCNGFKELGIAADVEFPRSLLLPTNAQGEVLPTGVVKGSFSTVISSWNDIMATINLPSFEIKGIDGIGFKIDNAVIDLSDYRNSADIVYPAGYQQKYLGNDATTLPLWRGVYAKEIRVTLPPSFDDRTVSERVSFGAKDLIIDNNGLTGLLYAENILPLSKGSAGGWQFSVDSFRIALEANRLLRAGFGGRVGLPVNKDAPTEAELAGYTQAQRDSIANARRFLAYSAVISTGGEYLCRVTTLDTVTFDVWKAKVMLKPNSYIELAGNKQSFKPSAMLHGRMDIGSKTSTGGAERTTKILDFKGIEFEGLKLQTVAPYVSAQYFGYNGAIKIGNFPVSIDSIALKSYSSTELGIGFNLKINLQDESFSGKTRLFVVGKYNTNDGGLTRWKYDRLVIEDITISAKIGVMSLNGTIAFLDNDPKYGDGFRGTLSMTLDKPNMSVNAVALFGNKGYRYWLVDGMVELPGEGISSGFLNINGFGGGAYYRMKKQGFDVTLAPTGLEYVPDSSAGLGIRASVLFNVGSKKLDHGQATLEVAFNRHGGMRYLGLYGYAKIMAPLKTENLPGGNALNFIKDEFTKIENKLNSWSPIKLDSSIQKKIFQPTAAAKDMYGGDVPASFDAEFRAVMGISYDFTNSTFHANFDLYVSTPGNILTGVGAGGRAGWAVIHIAPSKWYFHMGTPSDPIGIKLGLGPVSVTTNSYFMVGHDLPAFPPLPGPLLAALAQAGITYESNVGIEQKTQIAESKGLAFGASVHFSTGDIKFLILYANFSAGAGFDVMIKDYSGYICQETGQVPGFNGWYAQGRIYAYLQGEAGIRIKILFIKKKIPIIRAGVAALLEGRLPKPTWVGGLLNINVRLLGGKIKINVNLKFSFGSNCTLVANPDGGGTIDFDEFRVVTSVTPSDNTQNVSLFAKPQINCLTAPEEAFTLPPDEGSNVEETFRPHITAITFTTGTKTFGSKYRIAADGSKIDVFPDSNLVAQTNYVLKVNITYQKLVSGNWVNVTQDGTTATELTTVNFKTGDNPPFIALDNIGFMYPYVNQKFFYKGEATQGRVLLKNTQNELFASFTSWKARFIGANNQVVAVSDVTYNSSMRAVTYPVPAALALNTPYKMEIYGVGYVVGSLVSDTTRPILQFAFNTSQYNTLTEKLAALQLLQPVVGRIESDVIDLQAKVSQYEGFDVAEMIGIPLTGNMPLISPEADLTTNGYYNNKIQPLIRYPNFFPAANIGITRPTAELGVIPTKAISISNYYLTAAQSPNYNTILFDRLPFIYDLNQVFNADFIELRNRIVNKYMANMTGAPTTPMYYLQLFKLKLRPEWVAYFNSPAYLNALASGDINNIPADMRDLVTKPFPFMQSGDYKTQFKLRRAASWNGAYNFNMEMGNAGLFTYQNPIQTVYSSAAKTGYFTKDDCGSGESGTQVPYTVPAGTYTSVISQADADQKAQNQVNQLGQMSANIYGQCCMSNGICYVPGYVRITLVNSWTCNYYDTYEIQFIKDGYVYDYGFFPTYSGSTTDIYLPAGAYQMMLIGPGGYSYGTYITIENTWQTFYGTYQASPLVGFSSGTEYRISLYAECTSGGGWQP